LMSVLMEQHYVFLITAVIFSSIACFYYIRLIKIFFFVENSKNLFWVGSSSTVVNILISCFTIFTIFCLAKPTFLVLLSTVISVSLV
jgi:NADH:ubiquinone oxidoreductase subunit 2 (subunit N)